jgi:hypothetical protein
LYNRYIPQSDGTYRRNRIQDLAGSPEQQPPPPPISPPVRNPEPAPCSSCIHNPPPRRPPPKRETCKKETPGVLPFLKQLLPKEFEIEDLLIVLLLLLMAGDCEKDRNTALLTIALYLFM